ncbi:yjeF C-terminal region, hydroxyethylthiazole kinase-related/yjeF N-terminal region [Roseovarius azorensis]|uniref:Bifunctional NAD(P)H-hydrate repair enzyme n=1 Tax=Roseovarius azorensis TaxID=1287727 RepID=A0A1H7LRV5_9RHOB|nr:NAD(P)H-hydrate dehydratase [Roseovarius azorensis]SEL01117.1 yjeF C-terminal region, hydroxyethylthiazole kinase-related/yjeF N-terminal region [Roseovarius azorensis]
MKELLTAAQMRAIERAAIESGEVTGLELMERAGRGVVEAVFAQWPELISAPQKAMVLCGPGNNGGDGFVVARLLKARGWEVKVFLYGDPARLPPDARVNCERWCAMAGLAPPDRAREGDFAADLYVDALFGIGLTRPLEGAALECIRTWNTGRAARTVAIDLPSGLCSDSGRRLGDAAVRAALTVSFHAPKLGHHLASGPEHCGRFVVVDIGLRPVSANGGLTLVTAPGAGCLTKSANAHKYSNGHALILTGGAGRTGAARLAARGALRIGAGLVTLAVPGSAQQEVARQITALMLQRLEDGAELAALLADRRINALCLGPGLGVTRARELVEVVCGGAEPRPTVLDADALTAFGDTPEELFAMLHERCVLTPHAGEFARLFPDIVDKLNAPAVKGPAYSKVDATRVAARQAGCVVLFKGPDMVIAAPDGRCGVNSAQYDRAAPWLATAGSGDVLAGFITGLLARGFDPMRAAETAAWLHVECARSFGPGLIAEDLPEELPKVLRGL